MTQQNAITHLETIRQDIRDEVKRRIEQRDRYSIQLTIALGVIAAASFSTPDLRKVLIAAPLVSIYFTMLILYSYRVHRVLTQYLCNVIEPEVARLCGTSPDMEWETYYQGQAVPGIRESFFKWALWVVCLASLIYLWAAESGTPGFVIALILTTVAYIGTAIWITVAFRRK